MIHYLGFFLKKKSHFYYVIGKSLNQQIKISLMDIRREIPNCETVINKVKESKW